VATDDPNLVHILRGQEVVSKVTSEEITETGTIFRIKKKREISIKTINPREVVKKLMLLQIRVQTWQGRIDHCFIECYFTKPSMKVLIPLQAVMLSK